MIHALIKLKVLKLTMLSAIVGGFVLGTAASIFADDMCERKNKKTEEK